MITRKQYEETRNRTAGYFEKACIVISQEEKERIEVADFGLSELNSTGLELLTYVNTDRCCAKELVLFPFQTCPEHMHPPVDGEPGKEETFRCRWGKVYLYVDGKPSAAPSARPPKGHEHAYTVWHEIVLVPGGQYTMYPGTKHWFQAGSEGAVISEFSTRSRDEADIFTDEDIKRSTEIV